MALREWFGTQGLFVCLPNVFLKRLEFAAFEPIPYHLRLAGHAGVVLLNAYKAQFHGLVATQQHCVGVAAGLQLVLANQLLGGLAG